jgi:hypothetical protein
VRPSHSIPLGDRCAVALHRTLRVPDDGGDHPLPPGLGRMDVFWLDERHAIVPMRRAEALWLGFEAPWWHPFALKVGVGRVDAVSGQAFVPGRLGADPQDYVVIPDQPWLDGINAGDGFVRQFVAVPLGDGVTVDGQLAGEGEQGGLTLSLFAPRPGRFPEQEPPRPAFGMEVMACAAPALGLAAGGRIRQDVAADEHGLDTWQPEPAATVEVDLVDALAFEALTGLRAPSLVLDAATYTELGGPWFDLIDPTAEDLRAAERLAGVRSLADLEGRRDEPLPIPEEQVVRLLRLRELVA